jgi:tetratricopeptide (TPR) repeat protein
MGKGRQAIGIYRKLLTLRPELFWVRVRLGVLLLERQQYGSALEMFTIVLEARPEDVDVLYLQGFTLTELGRMDEARTVVEKLLAIAPEHELGQRLSEALENRN